MIVVKDRVVDIFSAIQNKIIWEKENYGQTFWSYKLPRQIGVTTFLKSFATEKARNGTVLFLTYNTDTAKRIQSEFIKEKLVTPNILTSSVQSYMNRKYDGVNVEWIICDNIMYSNVTLDMLKKKTQAKNINVLCIDTV
jgi:hypothetical protein